MYYSRPALLLQCSSITHKGNKEVYENQVRINEDLAPLLGEENLLSSERSCLRQKAQLSNTGAGLSLAPARVNGISPSTSFRLACGKA